MQLIQRNADVKSFNETEMKVLLDLVSVCSDINQTKIITLKKVLLQGSGELHRLFLLPNVEIN